MMSMSFNSTTIHDTSGSVTEFITVLNGVRVALSLVLHSVVFLPTFPVVDSFKQVFCDTTIGNLLI